MVNLGCKTIIQAETMLVLSQILQVDYCIQIRKAEYVASEFPKRGGVRGKIEIQASIANCIPKRS
jgi:hypothetical protein